MLTGVGGAATPPYGGWRATTWFGGGGGVAAQRGVFKPMDDLIKMTIYVGTEQRYEYTGIGAPVNEAARLSELAKGHPARVLAAGSSLERAGAVESAAWLGRGTVALRGRTEPTPIYEPVRAAVSVTGRSTAP